jgi:PRTRC genetic system protein E
MTMLTSPVPASVLSAPVLPEDKARASELWEAVKGTDQEQPYRDVSEAHPTKNGNRAAYLAFLAELETLFVVPQVAVSALAEFDPHTRTAPTPDEALEAEARAEDAAETAMDAQAEATLEGEDDVDQVQEDEQDEPEAGEVAESTPASPPVMPAPAATLAAPVTSGLLAQLAGMLADGGQLSFQMMRAADQLTLGIFPQPHPGEAAPQPLILTQTPDWLDAHLVPAMQGYAQARRDAYAVCQEAASKQQAANKRAAEKPAAPAKSAAAPRNKTYAVTLQAAEGSTLSAKQGGKDVAVVIGENEVTQGNLEVTVTHPLFGEQNKTLAVWGTKSHDFREAQGGRVRVEVTPESAALTATKGETTLALHGETLLPPGKWVITAEAANFQPATQSVMVKAGKAEVLKLDLKPVVQNSLF